MGVGWFLGVGHSVCLLGYFGSFGSGFFCSFEFSPLVVVVVCGSRIR